MTADLMAAAKLESLTLRKLADQTVEREKLFDPFTGRAILLEPEKATALIAELKPVMKDITPDPRPFLGLRIEGDPPKRTSVSTNLVEQGIAEGWIEGEDEDLIVRSSGPRSRPFGPRPHAFLHFSALTFKTMDGEVRYKVVDNPDKWPEEKEGKAGFGGEVRHYYVLQLEKS